VELLIWDKKKKSFKTLEKGKIKKQGIHGIYKRHFPIFMRNSGATVWPFLDAPMRACLHDHGVKVKASVKATAEC
jgi:hypothetical protein|tara:strand:+ start:1541 stop:1765 length:225 start_codon:yes stop_codon:yes gene_type:complete